MFTTSNKINLLKISFVFLCFLTAFSSATAQEVLYVKKKESLKKYEITAYDHLGIKTFQNDFYIEGQVMDVSSGSLMLDNGQIFAYDEIEVIKLLYKGREGAGKLLNVAGIAYAGIVVFNGTIGDAHEIAVEHVAIGAGIYAFGWLVRLWSKKKLYLKDYRLEFIDHGRWD